MKRTVFLLFSIALCPMLWTCASAQMVSVPFTSDHWDMKNAKTVTEEFQGKQSILINNGSIILNDDHFLNGTIEFDINFPGQRGFPGIAFRMQDEGNLEDIYIRPHKSGKADAIQYTPEFNGVSAWQLYHGPGYTDTLTLTPDTWHHIKLVIDGYDASFYFDNMSQPALHVIDLKREPEAGKVELSNGTLPVHFAGFKYEKTAADPGAKPGIRKQGENGTLTTWYLSQAFGKDKFYGKSRITDDIKNTLKWLQVTSEPSGLVNIAQYTAPDFRQGKITAVARCEINSDTETTKLFNFGFSDEVQLYFNDKLIYTGNDAYLSRDFQFSGVIGYYDAVCLPLKNGKNEVWMVMTDYFGGWGIQAKLQNAEINEVKVDPEILKQYVGEYELQPGFSITVTLEDGKLMTQGTGQSKVRIYAESPTMFYLKVVDAKIEFIKNDSGKFNSIILYQNGMQYPAKRK